MWRVYVCCLFTVLNLVSALVNYFWGIHAIALFNAFGFGWCAAMTMVIREQELDKVIPD